MITNNIFNTLKKKKKLYYKEEKEENWDSEGEKCIIQSSCNVNI